MNLGFKLFTNGLYLLGLGPQLFDFLHGWRLPRARTTFTS